MRVNKLHTPYGVKDYLPVEFDLKMEIERRIETVFHRYGFLSLRSPMFENMEVFEGKGSIKTKQMYKFIDRDGEILTLRSDMTPPIGRIAATNYTNEDLPLRFCYIENAFRYNESYQGKQREFTQAGIELIGINSDDANAEVIAVAINSLMAAGLRDFRIDIGQVQFFEGVMEETGLDPQTCQEIQNYCIEKNFVAVENLVKSKEIPEKINKLLVDLPMYIGEIDVIIKAGQLVSNRKALDALANLESIYHGLQCYGLEKYLHFDLSMVGHFDYYTGIIFSGYTFGTGFSILDGGRYDKLISQFGADFPSFGFAIKVNELLSALKSQDISFPVQHTDTLLVYSEEGRKKALAAGDELRSQGLIVENSLFGDDMEKNMTYAKSKHMGGILFFGDNEKIRLIDLEAGSQTEVTIDELLRQDGTGESE